MKTTFICSCYQLALRRLLLNTIHRIVSVSYQYGAGWNLASFPGMHPTDMNVNTLWARRDLAFSVFKYTGSYVAVTEAEVGTGYWMNHTSGSATHLTYTWNSSINTVKLCSNEAIPRCCWLEYDRQL